MVRHRCAVFRHGGCSVRRIVADPRPAADADAHALDARAAHYVQRVLRMRDGERVSLLDVDDQVCDGVLRTIDGVLWVAEIVRTVEGESEASLVVVAALIKPSRWEFLIEKATELGATEIVPVVAERSTVAWNPSRAASRRERWQRIVDQALRQCERAGTVTVHEPVQSYAGAVDYVSACDVRLVFDERAQRATWPTVSATQSVAAAWGPEGGLTDDERGVLEQAGCLTVGLGRHILRAETAVCAALGHLRICRDGLGRPNT